MLHLIGRRKVHGPAHILARERVHERAQDVVQRDPREPHTAAGEGPASSDAKRRQHRAQRTSRRVEDHTEAQLGHPRKRGGFAGLGFPSRARVREESSAPSALLGQDLVSALAVEADRRRRNKGSGWLREPSERRHERRGALRAAFADASLLRVGPAEADDGFPGQVDDGVKTLERRAIDPSADGIPLHLACRTWRAAHEAEHLVASGRQERRQS